MDVAIAIEHGWTFTFLNFNLLILSNHLYKEQIIVNYLT